MLRVRVRVMVSFLKYIAGHSSPWQHAARVRVRTGRVRVTTRVTDRLTLEICVASFGFDP